ncbi:glycoside hydrolase family 13 protein [Companilactobacillus hulinensis]|uniref:glycoside hydrolase family 13 protein n=1 Tax=Companilactobacillus hulinensis TaxID=2486007 RepID=UPI000F7B265F|nr:glycoside hydrolase family 13 protein [Companilactobacillus hulinensis]
MNTAAIYHRPDSEYAFLYKKDLMHLRIRTARGDAIAVNLLHGDTYSMDKEKWNEKPVPMKLTLSTNLFDYWELETKEPFNRMSYAFQVVGRDGTEILYGDQGAFPYNDKSVHKGNNYFRMPYFHEIDRFKAPDWVKKTVWYQIFPERFANGDKSNDPEGTLPWGSKDPARQDFFGGDLQGVIDHLDHLVDLGINGVYFCPIFKAHSNHKYDTIDYMEIDPSFGDKKLFKKLVEECHKRGIKVMLDAVFNHMGDNSPQWQDVVKNGKNSKYADWFHINKFPVSYEEGKDFEDAHDITYDVFATTPHMPKINTANPEAKKYLLDIAKYWIEEFDIDAWRLDVANEIDHEFWKDFRRTCDAAKKDFYILGEVWHSSQSWLNGDEFSAVMNYAYTDLIKDFFIKKEMSIPKVVSEINNQLMLYRKQTNQIQFNVLDSHDTARLLTVAGDDKDLEKQVLGFTYLQPGVPCVYYGDEYGMTGTDDPDCRKCMVWDEKDQDHKMYDFFKDLISFRKTNHQVMSEGSMDWDVSQDDKGLLTLTRELNGKTITGIFNTGNKAQVVLVDGELLLSNLAENFGDNFTLQPKGFVILN